MPPLTRSRLIGIGLFAVAVISGAWLIRPFASPRVPRFVISGAGECMFLLDQDTGIVRVFRGEQEVRRFDAPLALDVDGQWLDEFRNASDDDELEKDIQDESNAIAIEDDEW